MISYPKYLSDGRFPLEQARVWGKPDDWCAILDAALVNGGEEYTPSALWSDGDGIVFVTLPVGAGFKVGDVVLITNTAFVELNREFKIVGYDPATQTFQMDAYLPVTADLSVGPIVNERIKLAPLGWNIKFQTTGKRVYQSKDVTAGVELYFDFTKCLTTDHRIAAISMVDSSSIATASFVGTSKDPNEYWYVGYDNFKSTVYTNLKWKVIGDAYSIVFIRNPYTYISGGQWNTTDTGYTSDYKRLPEAIFVGGKFVPRSNVPYPCFSMYPPNIPANLFPSCATINGSYYINKRNTQDVYSNYPVYMDATLPGQTGLREPFDYQMGIIVANMPPMFYNNTNQLLGSMPEWISQTSAISPTLSAFAEYRADFDGRDILILWLHSQADSSTSNYAAPFGAAFDLTEPVNYKPWIER